MSNDIEERIHDVGEIILDIEGGINAYGILPESGEYLFLQRVIDNLRELQNNLQKL